MSFVYPWFLWALLAIAVPIIIHLFHFRRYKTLYFTNVKFLKEVKEQTSARSKLKHLLVLISRIFAVIFLVLAFSMPYIPSKNGDTKAGTKDVSIYFDNSFSMAAESEDVRLIEKARTRIREIINAYGVDDRIQILTADFEGRDQRMLSKEDALNRVGEIEVTHKVSNLSKVIGRQKQAVKSGKNQIKELYMVSDFQKNISDISNYQDTTIDLTIVPLQSVQNQNVAIDSAWFQSPVQSLNQPNPLVVKVRNLSEKEIPGVRMSLQIDNQTRPLGALTLPALTAVYDTIDVPVLRTGWHEAKLNITDYPIEFDNDYYFTFKVDEQVKILQIHNGQPNTFIQASFAENEYFVTTAQSVEQLNYADFAAYDLVILDELTTIPSGLISELKNYVEIAGNVVVFPHPQANIETYNNLCNQFRANTFGALDQRERKVSFINFQEFIFNDVFEDRRSNLKLPVTTANYKLSRKASSGEEVILRYRDGGTFVGKYRIGKGHLFLCTAPLQVDYSDLVKNGEIFVPMLYKMALSASSDKKIAYVIGKDAILETDNRTTTSEMVYKMQGGGVTFIPEQRNMGSSMILGMNNQVQKAGFYNLFLKEEEVLDKFSFNYDRNESFLSFYSPEELTQLLGDRVTVIEGTNRNDFQEVISAQSKGSPLWKYCLLLVLFFLAVETLLIRFWKV